jgi:hypothetical protein
MKARSGSLLKLEAIVDLATTDRQFAAELKAAPERAIEKVGIELTKGEHAALQDIILGTQASVLANPPVKTRNTILCLREAWRQL